MPKKKKEEETKTEVKETAIQKLTPAGEQVLALNNVSSAFSKVYGKDLQNYAKKMPSRRDFDIILTKMMDNDATADDAEALSKILAQTSSEQLGGFDKGDDSISFPEVRVFHGSGNDENRPEDIPPGVFYLTTKENFGKEFDACVIAFWKGRTMWPEGDGGGAPMCASMDRLVGSSFGKCETCPDKPWRDGKRTQCSDDVGVFLVTRDLSRLAIMRFTKTSARTGNNLVRKLRMTSTLWSKWWRFTLEKQTNNEKGYKWYTVAINPAGTLGTDPDDQVLTAEHLQDFLGALCVNVSGSVILPLIARAYSQSAENEESSAESSAEEPKFGDAVPDDSDDEDKYGEVPEEDTPNI